MACGCPEALKLLDEEEAEAWGTDGVDGTHEEVKRMTDTILYLLALVKSGKCPRCGVPVVGSAAGTAKGA
jgi:hypothetical protein